MLKKIILFSAFICLLPFTAPARAMGPGGPPPTVVTAAISEADIVPSVEYVGHVEAIQSVDLRARVEGFLEEVHFKDGDFVHAGEVLYTIEQAVYKARVAADEARITKAQAESKRATSRLKRLKSARAESIPATDMDNAVAAEMAAEAGVAEAEAALTLSRLNLGYTTIKAPISGRIGRTAYTVGNLVNPTSGSLANIVQVDPIRVVYSISENDLVAIQKSRRDSKKSNGRLLSPHIRLANGDEYQETGHVSFVDNQVDPATGTIAVRAKFANLAGTLVTGQYVTVQVKEGAPKIMPIVPQAAVLVNKDGRFVLMVKDGAAVPRPITIGPAVGTGWAVESGLATGEKIIVSGIQKVRPGQPVTVAPMKPTGR
jgi:membrane fusion protein (multidrug efflux system)